MAPSQRGLGVMMKRGRKGRMVRLNAPDVNITIEHVGVLSCEPRQLASEVPMCKTTGFVEAPRGSPWFKALASADCKQLMNLLQENKCRVVQKGKGGFTVLHAAAIRGCLKLLDQVFDLFEDNRRFVDKNEEIELSLKELLKAECSPNVKEKGIGAGGLTAAEFAWWSMGECKAWDYLLDGRRPDSKPFLSYQSEIFRSSTGPEAVGEGSLSPRTLLLEVLAHHRSLLPHEGFKEDVEYNFVADCEELRFHHACRELHYESFTKYVEAVMGGCLEKGPHVLRYLFQLRNAQGQTPLHVAAHNDTCSFLVRLIPGQESGENAECLNMRDSRGWTALHLLFTVYSDAEDLRVLLKDGRADVNATVEFTSPECTQATALHLAVINSRSMAVRYLLEDPRTDVNALFYKRIYFDENVQYSHFDLSSWTALQLAAVAGLPGMVKILITCPKVKDAGKRQKRRSCWARLHGDKNDDDSTRGIKLSAIHLAASSGDPETLRLFITNQQFDPLVTCGGSTSLHFAVASSQPTCVPPYYASPYYDYKPIYASNCVMEMVDFGDMRIYCRTKQKDAKITSYKGKEACISILVQAGVDVWQKDDRGNFPEPGRSASAENHLSWQQKVASETLEAKKSLNEAGNAISVVAALVATASYVGPLQPPLGYANDFVQSSNLSIRIFMITNSVSFYLAIASIMFAVVPSLPMPQEGIYEEWQRTRQTIGIAISLLLMSVLGVLISFAAASNAVVSEEYSWQHGGLTFYPVIVGGLVCLIGIIWFFIRLLRLIFPESVMIRHLYQSLFQIKGKNYKDDKTWSIKEMMAY